MTAASAIDLALGGHDMSSAGISIGLEDPRRADIRRLIAEADAMMQALYPAESNHLVDVDALAGPDAVFLAARRDEALLGSIALRIIAPSHGEMKRLFVQRDARGIGLGRRLVEALEEAARLRHIDRISLETGIKQPEAIRLYRACGYQECPPFGGYQNDPLSLFMTRRL